MIILAILAMYTPKKVWIIYYFIREIAIGPWCLLYFLVDKGYIQCRKAQYNQLWPIFGVTYAYFTYINHVDPKKYGLLMPFVFFLKGKFHAGKHNKTNPDQYIAGIKVTSPGSHMLILATLAM